MRRVSRLFAIAALALPFALHSAPVAAQQPTTMPPCDGSYNIVRVSEIKPGMMQKFLDAVAAQKEWYKKLGAPDQITVMRVYSRTNGGYSETQALTSHIAPGTQSTPPPHDSGYDAFVALFRASSEIRAEYFTCMK